MTNDLFVVLEKMVKWVRAHQPVEAQLGGERGRSDVRPHPFRVDLHAWIGQDHYLFEVSYLHPGMAQLTKNGVDCYHEDIDVKVLPPALTVTFSETTDGATKHSLTWKVTKP